MNETELKPCPFSGGQEMNKEKLIQIEEMAKTINSMFIEDCEAWHCGGCKYEKYKDNLLCQNIKEATYLYNAGYRKQSEGEWEEIRNAYGEIEGWICKCGREVKTMENFCPTCGLKMKKVPVTNCSNCANVGEKICDQCITGLSGTVPSKWASIHPSDWVLIHDKPKALKGGEQK